MQEIVLILSSLAGVATAAAVRRTPKNKKQELSLNANSHIKSQINTLKIEKDILTKTISRLYQSDTYYSKIQKDKLLLKYQHQLGIILGKLEKLEQASKHPDLGPVGDGLITIMDQKLSKLDNKLDELSKIVNTKIEISKSIEPEIKKQEIIEPEIKKQEIIEPEIKKQEIIEPEIKKQEIIEPEIKKQEIIEPEIKKQEIIEPEIKKQEIIEPEIKKQEIIEPEIKKQEIIEPEIKKQEIIEPEIKKQEIIEPEIKKQEIKSVKESIKIEKQNGEKLVIIPPIKPRQSFELATLTNISGKEIKFPLFETKEEKQQIVKPMPQPRNIQKEIIKPKQETTEEIIKPKVEDKIEIVQSVSVNPKLETKTNLSKEVAKITEHKALPEPKSTTLEEEFDDDKDDLDKIKGDIMKVLSKLDQAEVE